MKTARPIDTNQVTAPYIRLVDAAKLSGLPARSLRNMLSRRRLAGADYIKVQELNDLIERPQPAAEPAA